ncbi:SecY-interacting protein Syd [Aliamphritea spongicola]
MSVDNHTGEVWLELPGRPAIRKIAGSLSEFLTTLTPLPIPDTE